MADENSPLLNDPQPRIPWTVHLKYFGVAVTSVVGGVGQGIFLPLFISTFTATTCDPKEGGRIETGSYFVLFIMSSVFNFPFAIGCALDYRNGTLQSWMIKKHIGTLIILGICDGLNGLLVVFASSLNRTSGDLQAILVQIIIPLTLLFSRILTGRFVTKSRAISVGIVMFGIFLGIIPNIIHSMKGNEIALNWFYPLMFALAAIPGVLINVLQHKIFDIDPNYNKNWLLLCESFFQFLAVGLLFWTDLIPMFGTSKNMEDFSTHFGFGFRCFFTPGNVGGRCYYCALIGIAFALSYCVTYYSGSYLIQHGSANFTAMVNSINTPILMIMWYTITPMTKWGCGNGFEEIQIIMGTAAIPFLCLGAYLFHKYDIVTTTQ